MEMCGGEGGQISFLACKKKQKKSLIRKLYMVLMSSRLG